MITDTRIAAPSIHPWSDSSSKPELPPINCGRCASMANVGRNWIREMIGVRQRICRRDVGDAGRCDQRETEIDRDWRAGCSAGEVLMRSIVMIGCKQWARSNFELTMVFRWWTRNFEEIRLILVIRFVGSMEMIHWSDETLTSKGMSWRWKKRRKELVFLLKRSWFGIGEGT